MKTNRMFNRNSALLPAALLLAAGSMACSDAPAGPAANPGDMTLSVGGTVRRSWHRGAVARHWTSSSPSGVAGRAPRHS